MNRKGIIICMLLCLLGTVVLRASSAYPGGRTYLQPDGTTVTLYMHGNEYGHSLVNAAGERMERGEDGFYRVTEAAPVLTPGAERMMKRLPRQSEQQMVSRTMAHRNRNTVQAYRGLVILVDFTDRSFRFSANQTRALYDGMLNGVNYTGYSDLLYGGWQACPGSVRDYFVDNSHGQFVPQFDIVGPVRVNHPSTYINLVENSIALTEEILAMVNDSVDYSQYDSDGDGDVDMIYILYAGYSSMYQGNDERLVWPHANTMVDFSGEEPDIIYDGVRMARFACSNEIYGWQANNDRMIDGIGTIVHEFSHVLGFVDHYDTSSGYQEHPNSWDVMDGGNYSEDFNRTPCAYNSYEKATAGFITPLDITEMDGDTIELRSTEISTDAAIIHSTQDHVHFYMENRQRNKWDRYLVGHGLLVWRVDSVVPDYWTKNIVNVTTRACFRLVRARGTQGSFFTGVVDTAEDPFPGTANVNFLNNEPFDADLLSYDQYPTLATLQDITEQDSIIRMVVVRDTLSDARPIDHNVAKKFYARAERLVGTDWEEVEWEVTGRSQTISGQQTDVLYNLLPNLIGVTQGSSSVSGQFYVVYTQPDYKTFTVPARRLAVGDGYATWIANVTDVEARGGGTIGFTTTRHGIPMLDGEDMELGLLALTTTAYVASEANVLSVLDRYRNIRYSETRDIPEGIVPVVVQAQAVKILQNGCIYILRDGKAYTITGQPIHHQ